MSYVVVVGSLNMDLVVRVPELPRPGETVLGRDFGKFPGGKGANQAVAAARLGATVSMIGRVGEDGFGRELLENLTEEGIDIKHVIVDQNDPTGIAMINVDERGQNAITVASGANMCLKPEDVEAAWGDIRTPDVLLMPLEVPLDCLETAAQLARSADTIVVLNPAPAQELPEPFLKSVDIIIPNETETSILTGREAANPDQALAAARRLQELGVSQVVLTLGARGALILDGEEEVIEIPPHEVEVVDTTAAGDAFVAGLAVSLGEGQSLVESVRIANAAGGLATTRMGAQPSMPTREEVSKLLKHP